MSSWRRTLLFVGLMIVLAGVTVWIAPAERTLGAGIRAVYVHVALTVAGVVGLLVAALLGIGVLAFGSTVAARWLLPVGRVGLGLFAAGTLTSALAAWITWGGLFLDEPLLRSSLIVLSISFILHALMSWTGRERLLGLLSVGPAFAVSWALLATPVVFHPGGSVITESASTIQLTFLAVTVLSIAAGARLAWQFGTRPGEPSGTRARR